MASFLARPISNTFRSPSKSLIISARYFALHSSPVMGTQDKGPIELSIEKKLSERFKPTNYIITNDSKSHAGHAPMRAIGGGSGETHFIVEMVSEEFAGLTRLERQKLVYATLKEEFDQGLHSLSCPRLKTPEEVNK